MWFYHHGLQFRLGVHFHSSLACLTSHDMDPVTVIVRNLNAVGNQGHRCDDHRNRRRPSHIADHLNHLRHRGRPLGNASTRDEGGTTASTDRQCGNGLSVIALKSGIARSPACGSTAEAGTEATPTSAMVSIPTTTHLRTSSPPPSAPGSRIVAPSRAGRDVKFG